MKRVALFLVCVLLLTAQTAKYPTAVVTDADLKIAKNRVQTSLRGGITAAVATVVVASGTGIVPNMLLCIESEIVSVTSLAGTSLTVVRGFDGTSATAHSTGRPVSNCVAAWYWAALSAEMKAVQATLGANMTNVPGGGDVNGPAAGTGGEAAILDATGKILTRSALTGVLKSIAGVRSVVTGTASHCIKVDGSSGACAAGTGDVVGPGVAVDSNFAGFDTTTGKLVKDSGSKAADFAVAAKGVTNGDTHDHAGGDGAAIKEAAITLANNTTNDVSIAKHGFAPIAPNDAAKFLNGAGAYSVPTGSSLSTAATDPVAACTLGAWYVNTATPSLWYCIATNTWHLIPTSTGAGAGSIQFPTSGAMAVGAASTVKIGATTSNVLAVSRNGGALEYPAMLSGTNTWTGTQDFSGATVTPMDKHRTFVLSKALLDPVAADSGAVQFAFARPVTIQRVWCSTKTATSTVTMNLEERAEATPDTAGTAVLTSNLVCDTNTEATTTFTNPGIAARVPVAWTIASVANAPVLVRLHVEYSID